MLSEKTLEARLREILDEMDAAADDAADDDAESLEELNAEFEDALFMLREIKPEEMAAELPEALEEFQALANDYRQLTARVPSIASAAERLTRLILLAVENM